MIELLALTCPQAPGIQGAEVNKKIDVKIRAVKSSKGFKTVPYFFRHAVERFFDGAALAHRIPIKMELSLPDMGAYWTGD